MNLFGFINKRMIDQIAWENPQEGTLVYRFPMDERKIKMGAQLFVQDAQAAVFVSEGKVADVFQSGEYELNVANLPNLSGMRSWQGRESSFRADVYFVNLQPASGQQWTSINPIKKEDAEFGQVSIWASGSYTLQVGDPGVLLNGIFETNQIYDTGYLLGLAKSLLVNSCADFIAQWDMPLPAIRGNLHQLAEQAFEQLSKALRAYGLELSAFTVDSVSFSKHVEEALESGVTVVKKEKKPRTRKKKAKI